MSTEPPPGKDAAPRPGWLVEDRPELVAVRSRGLPGGAQMGSAVLGIAAMALAARFLAGSGAAIWFCVAAVLLWLLMVPVLQVVVREEVRATPDGLELERRGLGGTHRLVLTGRPESVRPPHSLLVAIFDPHLVVEHAGRAYCFARSMSPEARAWLLDRLGRLWDLKPPIHPPPREMR